MKIKRLIRSSDHFEIAIKVKSVLSDRVLFISAQFKNFIVDEKGFNKVFFDLVNRNAKRLLGHSHYAITNVLFCEPVKTKRFGWIENEVELDWFPKLEGDL